MSRNTSFKSRLTLFNSLTIIGAVFATIAVLFYAFDRVVDKELKSSLLNEARLIARIIDEDNDEFELSKRAGLPVEAVDLEGDIREFEKLVLIQKEGENKVYYSEKMPPDLYKKVLQMQIEINANEYILKDILDQEGDKYRFIYYRYQDDHGRVYRICVGNSLNKVQWATQRFMLTLVVGLPIICFFSSLVLYFISRKGLKPLDRILSQAESIKKENIEPIQITPKMPSEIVRLANALNKMLSRLEVAFEREKQFSGAASHELRTPLTALKGSMEVALSKQRSPQEYEQTLHECLEEVNHMNSIIENLLLLAKLDESSFDLKVSEKIDVVEVVQDVQDYAGKMEKGIAFTLDYPKNRALFIRGKRRLLHQAVYNLISNALKHAQPSNIHLEVSSRDSKIEIIISDDGKGIPEKELPYLFDRFYRSDESQNSFGYGLGLAIVKAVVKAHGGEVVVYSVEGKGTLFKLIFDKA